MGASDLRDTRGALVKAAFDVIARNGFEGLRTVAGAVGVNVAAFQGRWELLDPRRRANRGGAR